MTSTAPLASTAVSCVVESPSFLHRKISSASSSIASSNPAVFVRPSPADFQLQEALRQRVGQWILPSDSALGQQASENVRPSTANTLSSRPSSTASSALIRRQQAILAARSQQLLTGSVAGWERHQNRATGDPHCLPRSAAQERTRASPKSRETPKPKHHRTAPKSVISALSQRLRDSTFDSPSRDRPDARFQPEATEAVQFVPTENRPASSAQIRPHVSTISNICYVNDCSEEVKSTRQFSFEQQHHDDVHSQALERQAEAAASSNRLLHLRAFRSELVRQSKDFWRNHPMPTAVDLNKLMPDRGNNLRMALRGAKAASQADE